MSQQIDRSFECVKTPRVAVVIPCYNEAVAIGQTLDELRAALPHANLHVFDNNSDDGTADVARAHGASVSFVKLRGKGNVVRRMFADVQADVYVMLDGDATYDPSSLSQHVSMLQDHGLDMVTGCRCDDRLDAQTYRPGHRWGNLLLTRSVSGIFGGTFSDMLSGYRVLSRRYVKSFPANSQGFEIETELTVHALELRMPCEEVPVAYRSRPEGSSSKLSTYRDGWRILRTIAKLFIVERPLYFFSLMAGLLATMAIGLGAPLLLTYAQTGLVPRFPTAILSTGLMMCAMLSFVCGAVLHTVTMGRREMKRMAYLAVAGCDGSGARD